MKSILIKITFLSAIFFFSKIAFPQCKPFILIDGNAIIADENDPDGLRLPTWLKAAQTLNVGQYVYSISVIEFTINGTALDYSANLKIPTDGTTVPSGKVWKIEAVHKNIALPSFSGAYTYSIPGAFTFVSPACSLMAKVQVWGAGGGGQAENSCGRGGSGGGGGGYSEGFYLMPPNTSYTVTVGTGGTGGSVWGGAGTAGGSSSVSVVGISSTGGGGGGGGNCVYTLGAGGTGSGQLNFTGQSGATTGAAAGGKGGDGANDNTAGAGGSGGSYGAGTNNGLAGSDGRVVITIGASSTSATTSIISSGGRDRLQFNQGINTGVTSSCGYVVPAGKEFRLDAVFYSGGASYVYFGPTCGSNTYGSINSQVPSSLWFKAGTYFYTGSGTVYLNGLEFNIEP